MASNKANTGILNESRIADALAILKAREYNDSAEKRIPYESAFVNGIVFVNGEPISIYQNEYLIHLGNQKANGPGTTLSFKSARFTPPVLEMQHNYFYQSRRFESAVTYFEIAEIHTRPTRIEMDRDEANNKFPLDCELRCGAQRLSFAISQSAVRHVVSRIKRRNMQDAEVFGPKYMATQNAYERRLDSLFRACPRLNVDIWISSDAPTVRSFVNYIQDHWTRAQSDILLPLFEPSPRKWMINLENFATPDQLHLTAPEPSVVYFSSPKHALAARAYSTIYEHLYDQLLANEMMNKISKVLLLPLPNTEVNGSPSEFFMAVHTTQLDRDLYPRAGDTLDVYFAGGFSCDAIPTELSAAEKLTHIVDFLMRGIEDAGSRFPRPEEDFERFASLQVCLKEICDTNDDDFQMKARSALCRGCKEDGSTESYQEHKIRMTQFVTRHLSQFRLPQPKPDHPIPCFGRVIDPPFDMAQLGVFFLHVKIAKHPLWPRHLGPKPLVRFNTPHPNPAKFTSMREIVRELTMKREIYQTEVMFDRIAHDGPARAYIWAASQFAMTEGDTPFAKFAEWTISFSTSAETHQCTLAFPMLRAIQHAIGYRYSGQHYATELTNMANNVFDYAAVDTPNNNPPPPNDVDPDVYSAIWERITMMDPDQRAVITNMDRAPHGYQNIIGGPGTGKTRAVLDLAVILQAERITPDTLHDYTFKPTASPTHFDEEDLDEMDADMETERMLKNKAFYFAAPPEAHEMIQSPLQFDRVQDTEDEYQYDTGDENQQNVEDHHPRDGKNWGEEWNDHKTSAPDDEYAKPKGTKFDTSGESPQEPKKPEPRLLHPRLFIVATSNMQADDLTIRYTNLTKQVGLNLLTLRLTPWDKEKKSMGSIGRLFEADLDDPTRIPEYMRVTRRLDEIRQQANAAFTTLHTGGELDAAAMAYHILLDDYKDFARVHELQFSDPEAFSEMATQYNSWIDTALKKAVRLADTIIGTSYAAYKLANQGIWSADVVIHDEAARATEPETLTAWACFPHAYVRVTVGDPKQSPAISLSTDVHRSKDLDKRFINPFAHQAKLAFMERVELAGVFTTYLRENHRTVHGLADYCSENFYDGRMYQSKPAGATPDELRAIEWLRSYAPTMGGARLWLDVEGMTETRDLSTKNTAHANLIVDLVVAAFQNKLHRGGERFHILIITPYKDQAAHIKQAISDLSPMEYCAAKVEVRTVWDATGHEGDLVIVDWTRSQAPGFIGQPRIVNVAMSRSTCIEIHLINSYIFKRRAATDNSVKYIYGAFKEGLDFEAVATVRGDPYKHRCILCKGCHDRNKHEGKMCRFCPFETGRHHTRQCPAKSDHPPMAPTITDLSQDVEISPPAFQTVRGMKAYKGKTRADYNNAPRLTDALAPGEAFRSVEETRMERVREVLRNRSNVHWKSPSTSAPRPQRHIWIDEYVYPLRGNAYAWDEQVPEEAVDQDFDVDGNPIKLSDHFLHPPPPIDYS
ncbi:hypothetical protein DL769_002142 [Monosporascus sp. CRB-8-3]|nr:hypothetical protein DL769_002142 [Monosporascus sp. CRB-8-3]